MSAVKGAVFSEALKLEVVSGLREGLYSRKEAMRRYGIKSTSTIHEWQIKYGTVETKTKSSGSRAMTEGKGGKEMNMTVEEIAEMKKENRRMFLENLLFRAQIELLEEEHGVEGLKKRIPLNRLEEYERNRIFLKL